jgi:hypothetical protein
MLVVVVVVIPSNSYNKFLFKDFGVATEFLAWRVGLGLILFKLYIDTFRYDESNSLVGYLSQV